MPQPPAALPTISNYVPTDAAKGKFRFWHVEAMLNQGADLLDRALKQRSESLAALQAYRRLKIELDRRQGMQKIQDERIGRGAHRADYDTLTADIAAVTGATDVLTDGAQSAWAWLTHVSQMNRQPDQWSAEATKQQLVATKLMYGKDKLTKLQSIALEDVGRKERENILAQTEINSLVNEMNSGALNFKSISDLIDQRVAQDFAHAYDRLSVAAIGLKQLYNYTDPLPTASGDVDTILTSVALWNRRALQWLAAFQQLDQGSTYTASLRTILTANFESLLQNAKFSTSFSIPATAFDKLSFVRLRGISVVVLGSAKNGPWRGLLTLPASGAIRYLNDAEAIVDGTSVVQSALPKCTFGRVDIASSPRPPEICGLISLFNASPIAADNATWSLELAGRTHTSDDFEEISDICIELNVVARRAKV